MNFVGNKDAGLSFTNNIISKGPEQCGSADNEDLYTALCKIKEQKGVKKECFTFFKN